MSITSNTAKVIATCLILSVSMQICCSSAIPIWEFLTRNEKMSYLYSTFAQLVSMHCKATATATTPVNQCKRNLLAYGYEKLQTFSNEQLDAFDPYQRGASEIIWSSIMREHPSSTLITTRKPLPIAPATSIIILSHQNPVKPSAEPKEQVSTGSDPSNSNAQLYPNNPIFESDIDKSHTYAMDMDIAYGNSKKPTSDPMHVEVFDVAHEQDQQNTDHKKEQQTILSGPSVVRVRPDGTPVDNTHPKDEDLEAFQLLPPTDAPSQFVHAAPGRPAKHRKIATISALKHQYLNSLALQQQLQPPIEEPVQELQPPLERPRARRQFPTFTGYYSA